MVACVSRARYSSYSGGVRRNARGGRARTNDEIAKFGMGSTSEEGNHSVLPSPEAFSSCLAHSPSRVSAKDSKMRPRIALVASETSPSPWITHQLG